MAKTSSRLGQLLRTERELQGISLERATSATRIRRKFLEAFEDGDFAEMPPSGYARNMIVSYARFLGIGTQEALELFEAELKDYEFSLNSSSNKGLAGFTPRPGASSGSSAQATRTTPRKAPVASAPTHKYASSADQQSSRSRTSSSASNGAHSRSGSNASRQPKAASLDQHGGGAYRYAEQGNASYNHFKDQPQSKRPIVITLIVVALMIVGGLLAWAFLSPGSTVSNVLPHIGSDNAINQTDTVINSSVQSGGIDLTTGASSPFSVQVNIPEGSTSNLKIVIDGHEAFNGDAVGPFKQSYEVTKSLKMTIANPDAVQVSSNGNVIMPTISNGVGNIDIKVK